MKPPRTVWAALAPVFAYLLYVVVVLVPAFGLLVAMPPYGIWVTWLPALILTTAIVGGRNAYLGEGDRILMVSAALMLVWAVVPIAAMLWGPFRADGAMFALSSWSALSAAWLFRIAWRIGHPLQRALPRLPERQ